MRKAINASTINKEIEEVRWEGARILQEVRRDDADPIRLAEKSQIFNAFFRKAFSQMLYGDGELMRNVTVELQKCLALYLKTRGGRNLLKTCHRIDPSLLLQHRMYFARQLKIERESLPHYHATKEPTLENTLSSINLLRKIVPIRALVQDGMVDCIKDLATRSSLRDLIETATPYSLIKSNELAEAVYNKLEHKPDMQGYQECAFSRGIALYVLAVKASFPATKLKTMLKTGFSHVEKRGSFERYQSLQPAYFAMYTRVLEPIIREIGGSWIEKIGAISDENPCYALAKIKQVDDAIKAGTLSRFTGGIPNATVLMEAVRQGVYSKDEMLIFIPKKEQSRMLVAEDFSI